MPVHPGDSERRARLASAFRTHVPPVPPGSGPPRAPRGLRVFAVGTDWAQVTWRALGPGAVTLRVGDRSLALAADGGPGAATLHGLHPDTRHDLEVAGPGLGRHARVALRARTLRRPRGRLLHRIATISDIHLGSLATGYFHTIIEKPEPDVPHPLRCFRAAVEEATAWGADALVLKGDVVDASTPETWRQAGEVLAGVAAPVHVLPGNHEWSRRGEIDPVEAVAALGLDLARHVTWTDLPGVRLVLVDTTVPGSDWGSLSRAVEEVARVAGDTDHPVLVAMHHQPMRFRVPTYLPPGVPGPEARRFLSALGRANPRALVTSGHTHRHRRRRHGPVTVSEVGSPQDFPGTWAGYEIFEHGLVQSVHRIERPDCIRWNDYTRRAAAGVWQLWSPGRLDDRCFTLSW